MRVITGSAKGRRLNTPAGLETRPTSGLVKEAVFSAIQFEIEGADVLDLFAGSGQMGVEALSRGARSCVFVDTAKASQATIRANLAHTGLADRGKIIPMDVFSYLQSASGPVDIAFVDPPYRKGFFEKLLAPLGNLMRDSGVILCEADSGEILPDHAGKLEKHREYRYGKTKIAVYKGRVEDE